MQVNVELVISLKMAKSIAQLVLLRADGEIPSVHAGNS